MSEASAIVQRVWNYCNVLRDDGVSYGDYLEQLTYLLFLKMVDELEEEYGQESHIPADYRWATLTHKRGDALEIHYRHILTELGKGETGLVPIIFRKAQNKIQDPAKLSRLISLIEKETWIDVTLDVKAEIYEGLLEKNAQDIKSGAGQYFTPRPLIQAIVDVMQPEPEQLIADPACGTGGFLLAAYDTIKAHYSPLDRAQLDHLRYNALHGWEIVDSAARLCVMNLYLRGIGAEDKDSPIAVADSLIKSPGPNYHMVLTNPPFGKKSSMLAFATAASVSGLTAVSALAETTDVDCNVGDLRSKFREANNDDTLRLTPGCIYQISDSAAESRFNINRHTSLTVDGRGATIERVRQRGQRAPRPFRFFDVEGRLTLANLTLRHGDVSGPVVHTQGGAIRVEEGGSLNTNRVHFDQNIAEHGGGALIIYKGTVNVTDTTFSRNRGRTGGAIKNHAGRLVVNRTLFLENSAEEAGPAIANVQDGHTVIVNSTFTRNEGAHGQGSIFTSGQPDGLGPIRIVNSTIAGNPAGGLETAQIGSFSIQNTILANQRNYFHTRLGGPAERITNLGHNLVAGQEFAGIHNTPLADLQLAPLADNGGPTQTIAIGPNSAARGHANVAACNDPNAVAGRDQRGFPRDAHACDIGAFDLGAQAAGPAPAPAGPAPAGPAAAPAPAGPAPAGPAAAPAPVAQGQPVPAPVVPATRPAAPAPSVHTPAPAIITGSAKIEVPSRKSRSNLGIKVSGRQIKTVEIRVDNKVLKRIPAKGNAANQRLVAKIAISKLKRGIHKLQVRVTFVEGAKTKDIVKKFTVRKLK